MANPGIIEIIDVHKHYVVDNETLNVLGGLSLTIAPASSSASSARVAAVSPRCCAS